MFFVLNSGRSGSETICRALDSYNNCVCSGEPEPVLALEATQYLYGEYPGDRIAEILLSTRQSDSEKLVYGEVNLQLSLIVPVIEQVFPGAKYIWLIRDGRDVAASMYYRRWYDMEDYKISEKWKEARLQGDRTGDFTSSEWNMMNRFAKCCWLWKKYNLVIESNMQKLDSERWMCVRLDRLNSTMPKIAQFLGLYIDHDVLVEKLNVAYQSVTYWENWDNEMRSSFESYCGDVMDRWFPEWRTDKGIWQKIESETPQKADLMLRVKRWVAGLPLSALKKARELKKRIFRY
jgi:hypothetical protein